MKTKQAIKIPSEIDTPQFLRMANYFASRFKATLGYGRWLVEYQEMDEKGLFDAIKLRSIFKDILQNKFTGSFIVRDAVYNICINALESAKALLEDSFYDIRLITGETAEDDNGMPLTNLSFDDALHICKAMNEEAEEHLFDIYTFNKKVKLYD